MSIEVSPAQITDSEFFDQTLQENINLFNLAPQEPIEPQVVADDETARSLPRRLCRQAASILLVLTQGLVLNVALRELIDKPAKGVSVSLNTLPKQLPPAIKSELNNVGQVFVSIYNDSEYNSAGFPTPDETFGGSGIQISPGQVLTAGHAIDLQTGPAPINPSTHCEDIFFATPTYGANIKNDYGTTSFNPVASIPDVGAMATYFPNWIAPSYYEMPDIKVRTEKLKVGEPLFFVNYEPQANGSERDPTRKSGPAIYGGIYAGPTSYQNYDVITSLKSYGTIYDSSSRGGSSGGAVFDASGSLVGLSVRASDGPENVKDYEAQFNIKLKGISQNAQLSESIVQPVTQQMIDSYKNQEKPESPSCKPYF